MRKIFIRLLRSSLINFLIFIVMFTDFIIERELFFKTNSLYSFDIHQKNSRLVSLNDLGLIVFSKPKLVEFFAEFFPFFVLSNGSVVCVDVSFNRSGGTLLFEDLYV